MIFWRLYQVVMVLIGLIGRQKSTSFAQRLQKRQASSGCPDDNWKYFDGMCFTHNSEKLTYQEAKSMCKSKSEKAFVATIRSKEDFEFVMEEFKRVDFEMDRITKNEEFV